MENNSVIKDYLTTASDGKEYKVTFYSLDMILAIGFRVKSKRETQFRIWANRNLKEYIVKGFVMDDARLNNPGSSGGVYAISNPVLFTKSTKGELSLP